MNNKINTAEVILFNILYMFMNCDFDVSDKESEIIEPNFGCCDDAPDPVPFEAAARDLSLWSP